MKIAFRVDASLTIGTGHVMRCLTLADALRNLGAVCFFLSRDHIGNLHKYVKERGYPSISLGDSYDDFGFDDSSDYSTWLGVDWRRDVNDTHLQVMGRSLDLLVVDHYSLDEKWEKAMTSTCSQIMAIDDLANRNHSVQILLDQNLGKTKADYVAKVPASCRLMLGTEYALLKPEFKALKARSLSRRNLAKVRKVLITMGGVDLKNETRSILLSLSAWNRASDLEVTVVMGPLAPWCDDVRQLALVLPFPTKILVDVQNMGELMCEADLAIGAAGSTSWERCCLGLPTIQFVIAENQKQIADTLSNAGAAIMLSSLDVFTNLCEMMDHLTKFPSLLHNMSTAAASLVDGNGAERVAKCIKDEILK